MSKILSYLTLIYLAFLALSTFTTYVYIGKSILIVAQYEECKNVDISIVGLAISTGLSAIIRLIFIILAMVNHKQTLLAMNLLIFMNLLTVLPFCYILINVIPSNENCQVNFFQQFAVTTTVILAIDVFLYLIIDCVYKIQYGIPPESNSNPLEESLV